MDAAEPIKAWPLILTELLCWKETERAPENGDKSTAKPTRAKALESRGGTIDCLGSQATENIDGFSPWIFCRTYDVAS